MQLCVYYDEKKGYIIDIMPKEIKLSIRAELESLWAQPIARKVLIAISSGITKMPDIKKSIGHSASTLHDAVKKLSNAGFIEYQMIYKKNKQKVLKTNVLCVSKSTKSKLALQQFFRGLWVDSKKTNSIITLINSDPKKWWTQEEISAKTNIPIDQVHLLLSNFDSQTTRGLSQFLKKPPFSKKIMYKSQKQ